MSESSVRRSTRSAAAGKTHDPAGDAPTEAGPGQPPTAAKAENSGHEQSAQQQKRPTDKPSGEFLALFEKLDPTISAELIEKAWKQYDTVGQQIILEGAQNAWMACAFYVTVWQATPIGQELVYKYSVSKLLHICNLSVLEFFEKLNKWAEMINASRRLLDHVNRVQASLAVSTVVYKKFLPIFRRVFTNVSVTPSKKHHRSAAHAPGQLSNSQQLFDFIWTMFVAMKKQFASGGDDLMNSFHLLLCIVDTLFEELRSVGEPWARRFLQPEFVKSLGQEHTALEQLCDQFEGVVLDAKYFRTHWLMPRLRDMSDEGELKGLGMAGGLLTELLANKEIFDAIYEREGMLKRAEVDERLFISPNSATHNMDVCFNEALDATAITMLRRVDLDSNWAIDAELLLRMSTQNCLEKLNAQRSHIQTPLSARSYVITPEQFCPTGQPSADAQRAAKMGELLKEAAHIQRRAAEWLPSSGEVRPFVEGRLGLLEERFDQKVSEELVKHGTGYDETFSASIAQRKLDTQALFYRLLQRMIAYEAERLGMQQGGADGRHGDMTPILLRADFIDSVWVCALELQLFTHSSERQFPWSVVEVARLAPVNFYKIVELVIRAEPSLPREMVKHLSRVEERVLEELAWAVDSPLWAALTRCTKSKVGVPSYAQVNTTQGGAQEQSYGGRYAQSPMKHTAGDKRRAIYHDQDMSAGGEPRSKKALTAGEEAGGGSSTSSAPTTIPSSMVIFFRKFYYLAAVRLNDLCDRAHKEESSRHKVWTLFEHLTRSETSLMMGRHLDQQLMCCLYIVAKVGHLETSFHDIMYHYRHQPQAVSRVYRRVRLDPSHSPVQQPSSDDGASRDSISSNSGGKLRSGSAVPAPGHSSAPPTPEPTQAEEYVDLIKYYNRVFVGRMEEFVRRMTPPLAGAAGNGTSVDSKENIVPLIPMPRVAMNPISPRRLINEQINVMPLLGVPVSSMNSRPFRYNFNRSPSRDLRNINAMVRAGDPNHPQMILHGY